MKQHKLVLISPKGIMFKTIPNLYTPRDNYFDGYISYVVNGADPKARIKHIMECANLMDPK